MFKTKKFYILFVIYMIVIAMITTNVQAIESNDFTKLPGIQLRDHETQQIFGGAVCEICYTTTQCKVSASGLGCSSSNGHCNDEGAACGDSDGCSGPDHKECDSECATADDECVVDSDTECCTTTFDNTCVTHYEGGSYRCNCDGATKDKTFYSRKNCHNK